VRRAALILLLLSAAVAGAEDFRPPPSNLPALHPSEMPERGEAASPQLEPEAERPARAEESFRFDPGGGREARDFPLYRIAGETLPYLDLWDLAQMLQASRYFDPVTRKALLRVGTHRIKLTDGQPWAFFDGRARRLAAPCRILAGDFYFPLDLWPALVAEFDDLDLRLDPEALRVVGGPGAPNLLGLEWVHSRERLRALFHLDGKLEAEVTRPAETWIRLSFPGGRLSDFAWTRLPIDSPLDSLRARQEPGAAVFDLHLAEPPGEIRHRLDAGGRTWVLTVDLPEDIGLPEPPLTKPLAEPELEAPQLGGFTHVVIDPGHGGRDTGCVADGGIVEKNWTLRVSDWLGDYLREEGFQVTWTRRDDRGRPSLHRVQAANVGGGELYLSLHWTRRGVEEMRGMEIVLQTPSGLPTGSGNLLAWESAGDRHGPASLELALDLQRSLRLFTDWDQLGLRRESTALLRGLDMPALLLELGNLDSVAERAAWEDPPSRERRLREFAAALRAVSDRWEKEGRP